MSARKATKAARAPKLKVYDGRFDNLADARLSVIPGYAVDNPNLSGLHFRLLCHIGRQNAERGWLKISQTELAERWDFKRGSVNRSLRELEAWGLVESMSQKQSRDVHCCYRIKMDRLDKDVSHTRDTPHQEDVSRTGDTGVASEVTGVSRNRTPPNVSSLYASDIADIAEREGGSADAQPCAPEEDFRFVEAEVILPNEKPSSPKTRAKGGSKKPKATAYPLPEDWSPGKEGGQFALDEGLTQEDAVRELKKFRDHWRSNGERRVDWLATWRNWIRRGKEFRSTTARGGGARFDRTAGINA